MARPGKTHGKPATLASKHLHLAPAKVGNQGVTGTVKQGRVMGLRGQDRVFDQGSPGRQRQDVVKGYPPIHGPQITHQGHDFRLEHITGGLDLDA